MQKEKLGESPVGMSMHGIAKHGHEWSVSQARIPGTPELMCFRQIANSFLAVPKKLQWQERFEPDEVGG